MTGNPVIDATAIAGVAVYAVLLLGFPAWMLLDKLRPSHGEHFRHIGEAARVAEVEPVAEPKRRRSPFAPKQREEAK